MSLRRRKTTDPFPKAAVLPGLEGHLEIFSRHQGNGQRIQHACRARLREGSHGMFLFVDLDSGFELWLHADEVTSFSTRGGAF